GSASFAFEQAVESERRVELRRHGRHGRAPRDVRGVHHRIARFVEAADRAFTGQNEARQRRSVADAFGEQLIQTGGGAKLPTTRWMSPAQNAGSALGVSVAHAARVLKSVD